MTNQKKRRIEPETSENPESSRSLKREKTEDSDEEDDPEEHVNRCYFRAPTTNNYLLGCRAIFQYFLGQHSYETILADPSIVPVVDQRDVIKTIKEIPNPRILIKLFKEYDPHMRGYRLFHYTSLVTYLTDVEGRKFL